MLASRTALVALNLLFGPLVLVSYVASAKLWPEHVGALWGGVPKGWRTPYTANMFLAAAGYLAFTWHLWRHGGEARFVGDYGLGVVNLAYTLILIASCLWMPLTSYAVAHGRDLMLAIRLVLYTVAIGSLLMAAVLYSQQPAEPRGTLWAARIGVLLFCLQTVVLDALVWPSMFSLKTRTAQQF